MRRPISALLVVSLAVSVQSPVAAAARGGKRAARLAGYAGSLRRAANWLLGQQQADGSFAGVARVGKTGLALSALLSSPDGDKLRSHPGVRKAAAYLVSMQQPDGSINTPGERGLANYQTAAALTALCQLDDPAHKKVRQAAKKFLIRIQRTDGANEGGWGYNRDKRADASNTQLALEALRAAGLSEDSPELKRCIKFLERCQNRTESSDQPTSGNDGGGIYYPGASKAGKITLPNGKVIYRSYGSMTYALLRGFVLCGLKADDPRVQAVQNWLVENYTVDENPGLKAQGLYYYFFSMAKALSLPNAPALELPDGSERNWANDLGDKLVSLQHPDGYWVNKAMQWQEDDKVLATSFALLALHHCHAKLAKQR